jgi:hypothetical protein
MQSSEVMVGLCAFTEHNCINTVQSALQMSLNITEMKIWLKGVSLTRDFRSRSSTIVSLGSGSNNVSPVPVVSRFLGKRLNLSLGLLRGQQII